LRSVSGQGIRTFDLSVFLSFQYRSTGDDTKVRKLSGSRTCGDTPALGNSSWNTIF